VESDDEPTMVDVAVPEIGYVIIILKDFMNFVFF
jgi:hypothetical protein